MYEIKKENQVLVSVCVMAYNHAKFISQNLESILKQKTNFPFEVIIGEDESTDGTREICIEYAKKYPEKIHLFLRNRKDNIYKYGQPTGRFNFIQNIKVAQGKYIAIIDGDDYWPDELKLQKQVDFLENNLDYSFVSCRSDILTQKTGELKSMYDDVFSDGKNKIITENNFLSPFLPLTATLLFRKKCLDKINYNALSFGHTMIIFHLLQSGNGCCINEKMSVYRIQGEGIWNSASEYLNDKKTYFFTIDLLTIYKKELNSLKDFHASAFKKAFWNAFENKKTKDIFQIAFAELRLALIGFNNYFFFIIKTFPVYLKKIIMRELPEKTSKI